MWLKTRRYRTDSSPTRTGKGRRYGLLFPNGGAFAIAKVFSEKADKTADKDISTILLGSLTIEHLALGMIAFTAVMVVDIFAFGWGMKRTPASTPSSPHPTGAP